MSSCCCCRIGVGSAPVRYEFTGPRGFTPIHRIPAGGDVDGHDDIVAIVTDAISSPHMIEVHQVASSEVDRSVLYTACPLKGFVNPSGLAPMGDLNGDGICDFVFFQGANPTLLHFTSGTDGILLATHAFPTGFTPATLRTAGDVNCDGYLDAPLGVPGSEGRVRVFSGTGFALMGEFVGGPLQRLGHQVEGLGDLNGDGFSEFGAVFGSPPPFANPGGAGVYSLGGVPGGAGFFGVSLGEANASVMGVPELIDPDPMQLLSTVPFVFEASGAYSAPAPIRIPSAAGFLVRLQFFDLTPPFASSNGLEYLLLP